MFVLAIVRSFRFVGVAVVCLSLFGGLSCSIIDDGDQCMAAPCGGYPERLFMDIHAAGFTPPKSSPASPNACDGVGVDGNMRVRFVLADNSGRPIRLGETVDRRSFELTGESIDLSDAALMEVAEGGTCSTDDACSENFTCGLAPNLREDAASNACLRQDDGFSAMAGPDAVRFISDTDESQVYGLLMENSGTLAGWNPPGSAGAWDKNGDGDTGDSQDAGSQQERIGEKIATDFDGHRVEAVSQAAYPWVRVSDLGRSQDRRTYFGLWSFNDARPDPTSHVEPVTAGAVAWADELATINAAFDQYRLGGEVNARANVYEAIENVINNRYSTQAMEEMGLERPDSVDKQLVVFVDGYDDLREGDSATIDSAIEAATTHDVRLFIVHLDPKLDEPSELREDPMYPNGQSACSDDSECKNYEACTRPRGYAAEEGGLAEAPADADYDLTQTYCIPRRDDFGRTGPIEDYARLACATAGGYIYVASSDTLVDRMSWTPLALDGLWEADVASGEIRRGNVPAGAPLRIHTAMRVDVAGQAQIYPFSQLGRHPDRDNSTQALDNRGVVFTAP